VFGRPAIVCNDRGMKRLSIFGVAVAALALGAGAAAAKPITKQNGAAPLFADFTSICAIPGFLFYGNCNGNSSTYSTVSGRINAVQAKAGVWNLGVSFKGLTPGASYRLWGNRDAGTPTPGLVVGFFAIADAVAGLDGTANFSYQTTDPTYLSFDLNVLSGPSDVYGITVVTSYWSDQRIQVLNPDGTLYVPTA
jgi:hypothetical protein